MTCVMIFIFIIMSLHTCIHAIMYLNCLFYSKNIHTCSYIFKKGGKCKRVNLYIQGAYIYLFLFLFWKYPGGNQLIESVSHLTPLSMCLFFFCRFQPLGCIRNTASKKYTRIK